MHFPCLQKGELRVKLELGDEKRYVRINANFSYPILFQAF